MRMSLYLCLIVNLALLVGCGGQGGGGSTATSNLSMSLSTTAITVSASSQDAAPTATVNLTIRGDLPSTGLYYGWNNSTNMISAISDLQTANNVVSLTIQFAGASGKAIGTYTDTITVGVATDQAGQHQISGSPQTIQCNYNVINPPVVLTRVNPASAYVGGPAFTLTVTGTDFPVDAQVFWNGSPMPTTWISGTSLTAAVSATAIAVAGNAQITVASKDLEPSAGILFPVADSMATRVEGGVDCVWDGVHGVLYSSLLNGSGSLTPAIEAIDPASGRITAKVVCGVSSGVSVSGPARLAISDDCSFLYAFVYYPQVGVPAVIQRYALPALTLDSSFSIPLGTDSSTGYGYWVMEMAVAPGAPHTLAAILGLGGSSAGVEIFDDSQVRGSAILSGPADQQMFNSLAWGGDASTLYVLSGTLTYQLATVSVGASGPIVKTAQPVAMSSNTEGWDIHWVPATGYLYAGTGQVFAPGTGSVAGNCGSGWAGMAPDLAQDLGFYLDVAPDLPIGSPWGVEIHTCDLTKYTTLATTYIPIQVTSTTPVIQPRKVLRCGPSALVVAGGDQFVNPIWILTGPFAQGH